MDFETAAFSRKSKMIYVVQKGNKNTLYIYVTESKKFVFVLHRKIFYYVLMKKQNKMNNKSKDKFKSWEIKIYNTKLII